MPEPWTMEDVILDAWYSDGHGIWDRIYCIDAYNDIFSIKGMAKTVTNWVNGGLRWTPDPVRWTEGYPCDKEHNREWWESRKGGSNE